MFDSVLLTLGLRKDLGIAMAARSWSQCGEDLIVDFLLQGLGIRRPTYMDIGANHPFRFNNTYLFYRRGCRGVNIEPNPAQHRELQRHRPNDINLNIGIAEKMATAEFIEMNADTLSTFSRETAEKYAQEEGIEISRIHRIECWPLDRVFKETNCKNPDFVNIDVEGVELEIIAQFRALDQRPAVICIETLEYQEGFGGKKRADVIDAVQREGYRIYADTFINTILVRADIFDQARDGVPLAS